MQDIERLFAAALALSFAFATPARAQAQADALSDDRAAILGPTYMPVADATSRPFLPQTSGSGVRVTSHPYVREDGSTGIRKGIVGSMPLSRNFELRLGLLQVTRTTHKERPLQRTEPMKHVDSRTDRVAAIGLSISF